MAEESFLEARAEAALASADTQALVLVATPAKLEEARILLDQIKASQDFASFKTLYHAFLSAARGVTNALQKEAAHVSGFKEWYEPKQDEMREDELLRFVHEARTVDFHRGSSAVAAAGTSIDHFSVESAGPPPTPDAGLGIGAEGPFWIVDKGKPTERRVPIIKGGRWTTSVALVHAPKKHRGKALLQNDPISVASLAVTYLEELVHEARTRAW